MLTTCQGSKLGKRTLHVTVFFADLFEPEARTLAEAEYPEGSLGLAKAFANRELRARRALPLGEGEYYWARVELGEYTDTSWDDDKVGWVTDASWECDGSFAQRFAHLDHDGTIDWS